jgi:uncharacterized protein YdhG (YjbR/CyaY superfamily)
MTAIDDYLKSVDEPTRSALEIIRLVVKNIAPKAEEDMVYGVPGFRYDKHFFVGFSAHRNFLSLYPASTPIKILKDKLSKFDLSKGAIRFTIENQIPRPLLEEIIQIRFDEITNK